MKKFTVCLDVADINDDIKELLLINLLEGAGFKKYIESDSGRRFYLPKFIYDYKGDIDKRSLVEKVQAVVGQVSNDYKVLITESKGRIWFNLE